MPWASDPATNKLVGDLVIRSKQAVSKNPEEASSEIARIASRAQNTGVLPVLMSLLAIELVANKGSATYFELLNRAEEADVADDPTAMLAAVASWLQPNSPIVNNTAKIHRASKERLPWATKSDFEFHAQSPMAARNTFITGGTSVPYVTGPLLYTEIQKQMVQ